MKKTLITLGLVLAVGFLGLNSAKAQWGGGYGPGACNGPGNFTGETSSAYEDIEQFHNDTAELRKQIFEKRSEYFEVMSQETPDKVLAGQIWSEMFDLQNEMRTKAAEAGMPSGFGMRGRF